MKRRFLATVLGLMMVCSPVASAGAAEFSAASEVSAEGQTGAPGQMGPQGQPGASEQSNTSEAEGQRSTQNTGNQQAPDFSQGTPQGSNMQTPPAVPNGQNNGQNNNAPAAPSAPSLNSNNQIGNSNDFFRPLRELLSNVLSWLDQHLSGFPQAPQNSGNSTGTANETGTTRAADSSSADTAEEIA